MDVTGAATVSRLRSRPSHTGPSSATDPRHQAPPSFSFGGRQYSRPNSEKNTLASCRPFFCKSGTHRCPQGEILLDPLRRRDDKSQEQLKRLGQQWKCPPGPGAYRTTRSIGDIHEASEMKTTVLCSPDRAPTWRLDTTYLQRPNVYHTLGGLGHNRSECDLRRPPTPRNLSPGPGRYFEG